MRGGVALFRGIKGGRRQLDPCLPATDFYDFELKERQAAKAREGLKARRLAAKPRVRIRRWEPLLYEEIL